MSKLKTYNGKLSKKNNMFAAIALMCTLGITIAAFIWLHVEPTTSNQSSTIATMPLEEQIKLLYARLDNQQAVIDALQEKIKRLENLNKY